MSLPTSIADEKPPTQRRFQEAYDVPKRAIGWWEPDHHCVGIVQAWLRYLEISKLEKSCRILDDGKVLLFDGIFGQDTFDAVYEFQRQVKIKRDGLVGKDTLDKFAEELTKHNRRHTPIPKNAAVHVQKKPCSPNVLICAEP